MIRLSHDQLMALSAKLRRKRRQKILRARGVGPPRSIEAQYYRALVGIVRRLTRATSGQLLPLLESEQSRYIRDAYEGMFDFALANLASEPTILETARHKIATDMVRSVESFNRRKFVEEINRAAGINLQNLITVEAVEAQIETAVASNIGLIKSIPEQYHAKLRGIVHAGIAQGNDFFSIRKQIIALGHSTEKRAKLIARDQIAKLNSALTQQRQQSIGVSGYFWRTVLDERVREDHAAHEGERFEWDNPPADTGHPGHDIQCRCIADPDLSHLLELSLV